MPRACPRDSGADSEARDHGDRDLDTARKRRRQWRLHHDRNVCQRRNVLLYRRLRQRWKQSPHHRHDRRLGNGLQSRDEGKRRSRVVFPQDRGRCDRDGRLCAAFNDRKLRSGADRGCRLCGRALGRCASDGVGTRASFGDGRRGGRRLLSRRLLSLRLVSLESGRSQRRARRIGDLGCGFPLPGRRRVRPGIRDIRRDADSRRYDGGRNQPGNTRGASEERE